MNYIVIHFIISTELPKGYILKLIRVNLHLEAYYIKWHVKNKACSTQACRQQLVILK